MSEVFINEDFLLSNQQARELYHSFAKDLPIIDYHSHLPPDEIAQNKRFRNLTNLWIDIDHYKWRAMRALGIPEKYISGDADAVQKFEKWAYTVPYSIRNPLYHWTHLELQRYFCVSDLLNPKSGPAIYQKCNDLLQEEGYQARGLVEQMGVEVICTTDDPTDDLSSHEILQDEVSSWQMLPTFRPDKAIHIDSIGFNAYVQALGETAEVVIKDWESMKLALDSRMEYFHSHGCRLSDHGLDHAYGQPCDDWTADHILKKKLRNEELSASEIIKYKSAIMCFLGSAYAKRDWTMQLHLGPIRNNNSALLSQIGLDAGVDSIGDFAHAIQLSNYMDALNVADQLPKTILYNSNPADNELFATMAGNFNEEGVKGKVQYGAAWWFLDQKDGIEKQISALSNMGLLSTSIGMLTDSRSFLSFPRHEYFRRVLCNVLGREIESGELPNDLNWIGQLVEDICYNNVKEYLQFPLVIPESVDQ